MQNQENAPDEEVQDQLRRPHPGDFVTDPAEVIALLQSAGIWHNIEEEFDATAAKRAMNGNAALGGHSGLKHHPEEGTSFISVWGLESLDPCDERNHLALLWVNDTEPLTDPVWTMVLNILAGGIK